MSRDKFKRPQRIPSRTLSLKQYKTFGAGMKHRSVQFSLNLDGSWNFRAKLGYFLWGLDVWVGKIPMLKLIIAVNILVWIAFAGGLLLLLKHWR